MLNLDWISFKILSDASDKILFSSKISFTSLISLSSLPNFIGKVYRFLVDIALVKVESLVYFFHWLNIWRPS